MNVNQRKSAAFCLMFLSILPVMVSVSFVVQQSFINWQMKEALEKENLTAIILEPHELNWHREGEELIYLGNHFDVKEIKELESGKLLVTGLFDTDEDKLDGQIADHNRTHNSTANKVIQKFFSLVSTESIVEDNSIVINMPLNAFNPYYQYYFASLIYPLVTPPPEYS